MQLKKYEEMLTGLLNQIPVLLYKSLLPSKEEGKTLLFCDKTYRMRTKHHNVDTIALILLKKKKKNKCLFNFFSAFFTLPC